MTAERLGPDPLFLDEQVLEAVRRCRGRENALNVADLVRALSGLLRGQAGYPTWEREIRRAMKRLVEERGEPICSTPMDGVYMADTAAEVDDAYARYRKAGLSHLKRAARLRNLSLPTLLGQLRLEETEKPL